MRISALEKRLRALEEAFSVAGKKCTCRRSGRTTFHTAEELARIMGIRCPAHGFCDLGYLRQLPRGLPLQPDDENFCSCPLRPVREFLRGRRGPLTDVEQEEEEQRWEREYGPESDQEFRHEQARIQKLLVKYEYEELKRGGM